jgi:hypothetical protein
MSDLIPFSLTLDQVHNNKRCLRRLLCRQNQSGIRRSALTDQTGFRGRSRRYLLRKLPGKLERAKGIEPSYAAWEAAVLPLNYARNGGQSSAAEFAFQSPKALLDQFREQARLFPMPHRGTAARLVVADREWLPQARPNRRASRRKSTEPWACGQQTCRQLRRCGI